MQARPHDHMRFNQCVGKTGGLIEQAPSMLVPVADGKHEQFWASGEFSLAVLSWGVPRLTLGHIRLGSSSCIQLHNPWCF